MRYRERKEKEGYFGSSTPSSRKPFKENSPQENRKKRGGAKPGHAGHGRKCIEVGEADRSDKVAVDRTCPYCHGRVESRGYQKRSVIDLPPIKTEKVIQYLEQGRCTNCGRKVTARARGVLPNHLYGNGLLAQVATLHYLHGIPLGRQSKIFDVNTYHLIDTFHRLSVLLEPSLARIIELYRTSPVKHADETGWRTDGESGYAWIFCTETLTIFRFRNTRSAIVPDEVFMT